MRRLWLGLICVLLVVASGCSGPAAEYGPGLEPGKYKPAAPERAAVLDAVDAAVTRDVGQPITLSVQSISIRPPFAAVSARPADLSGNALDYAAIPKYAPAVQAGAFDDQVLALLKKSGDGWTVLEYELGSTDFPGQEWAKKHGAPQDIFGQ